MSVPTWRGTNGSHLICTRLPENSDPGEGYPQTEPPTSSDRAIWSAVPSGACRWRVTLGRPLGRGAGLERGQLLTYCKFEMFGEEILQLGDALVNPVTSLFLDEPVRQFVGLLRSARGDGGRGRTGVRSPPPLPAAARGVGAAEQSDPQNQLSSAPSSPGNSVEAQSPHLAYPLQPQSEKTFTGNSARARGWGPEGARCSYLTILAPLYSPPRLVHLVHMGKIHPAGKGTRNGCDLRTGCRSPGWQEPPDAPRTIPSCKPRTTQDWS